MEKLKKTIGEMQQNIDKDDITVKNYADDLGSIASLEEYI
jgi:hypothetical protein